MLILLKLFDCFDIEKKMKETSQLFYLATLYQFGFYSNYCSILLI